jgi:hypothetical protein
LNAATLQAYQLHCKVRASGVLFEVRLLEIIRKAVALDKGKRQERFNKGRENNSQYDCYELGTGKFEVSVCVDGQNWINIFSSEGKGKPDKATIASIAQSIGEIQ